MKIIKILLGLLILIFVINNAGAFGVATPFAGNSVYIPAGETKDLAFIIQNGAGATEEVIAKIEVLEGNEIIKSIDKEEYLVPAEGEVSATIKIATPRKAIPDDKWNVKLYFKATSPSKEGKVNIGQGVVISFDVIAEERTEMPTGQITKEIPKTNIYIAIGIIIIVTIIYLLTRKKNKKKK